MRNANARGAADARGACIIYIPAEVIGGGQRGRVIVTLHREP